MGLDEQVMPHIDQANIACGFHAGDPLVMQKTLELAKKHKVCVGAHPSYPDLVGFGRRSMNCSFDELVAMVNYQIAAIDGVAKSIGVDIVYVKPHGALYNDMMVNGQIRLAILTVLSKYPKNLALMLQATPDLLEHRAEAKTFGIEIISEAFADRCYQDNGKLTPRSEPFAVHNKDKMLEQVKQLIEQKTVTTASGENLLLDVDSICVHGDNLAGVQAISEINRLIKGD
jgi:UPF0271 protein